MTTISDHCSEGDSNLPPGVILALAREKIAAFSASSKGYLSKILLGRPLSRRSPAIHVRQFAECNLETHVCCAPLVNEWLITETRVISIDEHKSIESDTHEIIQYMKVPIIEFAENEGKFNVITIEPSGKKST